MSSSTSSSTVNGSSRGPQIIAAAVTAAAALGAGLTYLMLSSSGGVGTGGGRRAFRSDSAVEAPRQAIAEALAAIRSGRCTTCGELVAFLRGSPTAPVPAAARLGVLELQLPSQKLPPANAFLVRVPYPILHYIEVSYLPAVRRQLSSSAQQEQASTKPPASLRVEWELFNQLWGSDLVLRRMGVERASVFDNDNRSHLNLLQQLWMATGKPATAYNRLGSQWSALGFQGEDPVTDLRGGGILALRQLVHFAQAHNTAFREMMAYNERIQRENKHSWYLLAVVSIQLSTQLILEQDHQLHLPHLELIYDTLRQGAAGDATAKLTARRALAAQKNVSMTNTRAEDTAAFWETCAPLTNAEAGMFALHHALLLHFKACWERDEPHVMEYNTYMPSKVFATFFSPSWKDTILSA
ncbi:putative mitochondrial engulfment and cell motility domain 2 [Leptomonas pyrrhocoris]|uniref:Putative mitochondrial engulfment and cell motility domain 2 n=1 Tax=Leptomonas pyrrhocoris TaxID=157538 RepID=A0A0M9FQT9_LEPPY|nr:putative mitochondrial engulfment and cell motility domain 2 [Leptomonas pyrrhocoris]XP_015652640.1 putative mitochondrial engulfment and cell motility domain 2 [Leptomonas pyrrhocoris]KPA74200.1 putative mitochondrial engulfment and cell motility domain 2 [Leptomonas pyrrhocoris]KPA74201.1 putative mitochondrial engulfment and cell motility domain 2 [Leptomonas pyrrhocoris]|eukprot:XP_015652639.1 putative mitochondrial engulfment and cell motility domain 2 [Leptomonas pyrrhocoris]